MKAVCSTDDKYLYYKFVTTDKIHSSTKTKNVLFKYPELQTQDSFQKLNPLLIFIKKMSDGGYKIRNKEGIHFITFAVVEWVDVFTRKEYRDILLDSIRHCQKEKGLLVRAWCVMSNHVHLVISAKNNDTSDILRDFKKFSGKKIIKAMAENEQESRRDWMLEIFKQAGAANSRNSIYQFWRQDNQPKELFSEKFTDQKLNYIHNNPVEVGIVEKAEDYLYSSAKDYFYGKQCGLLEIDFLC